MSFVTVFQAEKLISRAVKELEQQLDSSHLLTLVAATWPRQTRADIDIVHLQQKIWSALFAFSRSITYSDITWNVFQFPAAKPFKHLKAS